jgi:hypothetical protein
MHQRSRKSSDGDSSGPMSLEYELTLNVEAFRQLQRIRRSATALCTHVPNLPEVRDCRVDVGFPSVQEQNRGRAACCRKNRPGMHSFRSIGLSNFRRPTGNLRDALDYAENGAFQHLWRLQMSSIFPLQGESHGMHFSFGRGKKVRRNISGTVCLPAV